MIELLVVIAIIALLIGILLPVLSAARTTARTTQCLARLHQLGVGVHTYAHDYDASIPLSPNMPSRVPPRLPVDPELATNQLFAAEADPADSRFTGVGLLLDGYLEDHRAALCPASSRKDLTAGNLSNLRVANVDAFSNLLYRNRQATTAATLDGLGKNLSNQPANTLAYDFNQTDLGTIGLPGADAINHGGSAVNALHLDAHADTHPNADGRFSWSAADPTATADIPDHFATLDSEG